MGAGRAGAARHRAPSLTVPSQRLGHGAGLLVLSMAGFALSDAMAKQVAGRFGAFEIAWLRYLALLATALPWALLQPAHARSGRPGLQFARAVALVGSAVLFLYGLQALPVAEATAMVFASPLFVTLLAVLVLREVVEPARWVPVLLGFSVCWWWCARARRASAARRCFRWPLRRPGPAR
jgi:drug/metabolite transporter (DMT)-like permease